MRGALNRRQALGLGGAGMAALAAGGAPLALAPARGSGPLVGGIHLDQPWHDPSGEAEPYLPAIGARGAAAAAMLDEEGLRRLQYSI